MAQTRKITKGGKALTTSDVRKAYYAHYGSLHGLATKGNKFTSSKEHRGCGPLARYNRRKMIEAAAIADRGGTGGLWNLPYTDETFRMLADIRKEGAL